MVTIFKCDSNNTKLFNSPSIRVIILSLEKARIPVSLTDNKRRMSL